MRYLICLALFFSPVLLLAQSKDEQDQIFEKVDVDASVDAKEWIQHLQMTLQTPIEKASNKGMKAGTYTVKVRFIVEKNGSVTSVKAENDPGYGLAKAAEKALKTGPKWQPGEKNGKKVRSYHMQPITFIIQEG